MSRAAPQSGLVQTSRLKNGLRIITHHMPHLETVSMGIWVGVGARFEKPGEHGISHMLEHMAFKGTKTRSARAIVEEIETAGGDLNAATSFETTAYYARVLKEDSALALELLADIVLNPVFDEEELKKEREIVLHEIAAGNDSPDDIVFDQAQEMAFSGQPLGRPILGTNESVRSFRRSHLNRYMNQHYQPGGMIVAAAGAVDHDALVGQAEKLFLDMKPATPSGHEGAVYRGGETVSDRPFEQSHLLLAFEGIPYLDEDYYAAQVFSSLFGGGMSSRLFQEVREMRGLCYSIYSFNWGFADTGLFGVHAATGFEQMKELGEVVVNELKCAASKQPDAAELARAKAQLKAGLLMSLESSSARAEQLARQLLAYDRPLEISELIEKVEQVSASDIRNIAQKLVTGSPLTLSTVGSRGSLMSYETMADLLG